MIIATGVMASDAHRFGPQNFLAGDCHHHGYSTCRQTEAEDLVSCFPAVAKSKDSWVLKFQKGANDPAIVHWRTSRDHCRRTETCNMRRRGTSAHRCSHWSANMFFCWCSYLFLCVLASLLTKRQDTQSITSVCVSPSSTHLLAFSASLSLRVFELPRDAESLAEPVQPLRVIAKAHDSPVHVSTVDPTSTYMASGSADGVVKVWDILRGYITHVFKGHGGVVSALKFNYPQDPSSISQRAQMQLITASVDTRIRIFELSEASRATSKPAAILDGHVSVPRALDVSADGKFLLSGGRDSVVFIWELAGVRKQGDSKQKGKAKESAPKLLKTIPILERVEAAGLLGFDEDLTGSTSDIPTNLRFYTGGENGVIKIWSVRDANVLFKLGTEATAQISDEQEEQRQIVDVL